MKSIFFLLSACSAVAQATECQAADETTLFQGVRMGGSLVRKGMKATEAKSWDAQGLVKSLRHVANNLDTMSTDEVNEALQAAADALASLSPAIQDQVAILQNTILHAAAPFEACHVEQRFQLRAALWEAAEAQAAEVANCEAELATAIEDQANCGAAPGEIVQSECACNEARMRRQYKEELCASIAMSYEFAYCEHNLQCSTLYDCHKTEIAVYNQLRDDMEAEMVPIELEYIAAQQSTCIMDIIQIATQFGSQIDLNAIAACSAVDTSPLLLVYQDSTAAPEPCPASTTGSPVCDISRFSTNLLPASGFYRIQQKQGMKYMDAYESAEHNVVTRTRQDNPSQWWYLQGVGALEDQVYTIQQVGTNERASHGRYLDAHENARNDYRVTTRPDQGNDSQRWHFTMVDTNTFTLNHGVNTRFLDAYVGSNDGQLVTRDEEGNDTQRWVLTPLSLEEQAQARGLL